MHEPEAYAELNPFTAIWTRPRETVRYVIEEKRGNLIFWLIVLLGFSAGLSGASSGEQLFPAAGVIIGSLLLGPIFTVAGIAIASGIYLLLGKLFKGVGTYTEMFRAVVTSSIPQIWLLPMWLLWLLLSPGTFYTNNEILVESSSGGVLEIIIVLVLLLAVIAVGIWTFVIQCKAVGEAQRISAWKGLFIILTPSILVAILVSVIGAFLLFTPI
ncbi:Yip1 family protein [Planococcus dechangensis]|uniref:Yip1 family protein n=1 Tax=Planococcus dechangensis TaxID=1176255 RepID=A0ABV9MDN8_9BACL